MTTNSCAVEGRFNFNPIELDDIPASVQEMFLARAALFIPPGRAPEALDCYTDMSRCDGIHGTTLYRGMVVKEYEHSTENTVQLVEADKKNRVVGRGEVRFEPNARNDFFKNKPFVGGTFTGEKRRGEGLGRHRLLAMNLTSRSFFGLYLYSGTIFSDPSARHMWQELVSAGMATRYMQKREAGYKSERFCFNQTITEWPVNKS